MGGGGVEYGGLPTKTAALVDAADELGSSGTNWKQLVKLIKIVTLYKLFKSAI